MKQLLLMCSALLLIALPAHAAEAELGTASTQPEASYVDVPVDGGKTLRLTGKVVTDVTSGTAVPIADGDYEAANGSATFHVKDGELTGVDKK